MCFQDWRLSKELFRLHQPASNSPRLPLVASPTSMQVLFTIKYSKHLLRRKLTSELFKICGKTQKIKN